MSLLLHLGTISSNSEQNPGVLPFQNVTPAQRVTNAHFIQLSLTDIIFAGVFDRYPYLRIASVEHELGWIPFWLNEMDYIYRERPMFTKDWKSKEGLLPSDFWHRNMFAVFLEDQLGVRMRDVIGVDNMLWGNDFPHIASTWPKSMEFLHRLFDGVPDSDRDKIISGNATRIYRFAS